MFEALKNSVKSQGFQLLVFLCSQLMCIVLALFSLQYIEMREQLLADMRIQGVSVVLKDKIGRVMDTLDDYANEVSYKLSYYYKWDSTNTQDGFKILKEIKPLALSQLGSLMLIDKQGIAVASSLDKNFVPVNLPENPYFRGIMKDASDKGHYGPYVSTIDGTITYSLVHKLTNAEGLYNGVILVNANMPLIYEQCTNLLPSEGYEAYVVNDTGKILLHCKFTKALTQDTGIALKEKAPFIQLEKLASATGKQIGDEHLYYVDKLAGFSNLTVVTVVTKEVAYSSLDGLIWQNYILLMVAMLSQVLCFVLFYNLMKRYHFLVDRFNDKKATS